jgi:hypothetical protein
MAVGVYKCREDYRVSKINHRLTRFGNHLTPCSHLGNPLAPNPNRTISNEIPLASPYRA